MPLINRKVNNIKPVQWNKDDDGAKYYNSKYWKNLRNAFIREHPLCYDCALEGKSTPAEECHHIIPFYSGKTEEEKWNLLLDPDNLCSLCQACHHKRHTMMNRMKRASST